MEPLSFLAGTVLAFILAEYMRRAEDRAFTRGRLSVKLEHIGREGGK